MASEYLKKRAAQSRKTTDARVGSHAYGGSEYIAPVIRDPERDERDARIRKNYEARPERVRVPGRFELGMRSVGSGLQGSLPSAYETGKAVYQNRWQNMTMPDHEKETMHRLGDAVVGKNRELMAARLRKKNFAAKRMTEDLGARFPMKQEDPAVLREDLNALKTEIERHSIKTRVDPNSYGQRKLRESGLYREKALDGMKPAGRLLAETGLGLAQNVPALGVSLLNAPAGLALMGGQAAGQRMYELNEQGVLPESSLRRGLASGGVEVLTGKIPLDNLLGIVKAGGGKSWLKTVGKQMGIEATEEGASYALNKAADVVAQDPTASWSWSELLNQAAQGGISGGVIGTAAKGINAIRGSGAKKSIPSSKENAPLPKESTPIIQSRDEIPYEITATRPTENAERELIFKKGVPPENPTEKLYYESGKSGLSFEQTEMAAPDISQGVDRAQLYRGYISGQNEGTRAREAGYFGENAGLVRNEWLKKARIPSGTQRSLDALGKVLGVGISFEGGVKDAQGNEANASIQGDHMRISLTTETPVLTAAIHESVHRIRETDAEAYSVLRDFSLSVLKESGTADKSMRARMALYETTDSDMASEELVADAMGTVLGDGKVLDRFVVENRSIARRFMDAIRDTVLKIRRALGDKRLLVEKQRRHEFEGLEAQLTEVSTLFEASLRRAESRQMDRAITQESKNIETEDSTKGEEKQSRKGIDDLLEQYGAIPPGEVPVREVSVPQKSEVDKRVRRFVRTTMEAGATPDEMIPAFQKEIENGTFSYEPITDKAAWARAEGKVKGNAAKAQKEWEAVVNGSHPASKEEIALGEYLYIAAANRGEVSVAMKLAAEIAAEGTRAGQTVQAMRLLKKMSGAGQLYYVDQIVHGIQEDLDKRDREKVVKIEVPDILRKKLGSAVKQVDIDAAVDEILTNVAEQMPRRWVDKWNAWRYLSMLGNPRTHIRNLVGNAVFEPMIVLKNVIGAGIEGAVDAGSVAVGKGGIERSKSVRGAFVGSGGALRKFAMKDFEEVRDIMSSGGKMNPSDIIRDQQRIFRLRLLEWGRRGNTNLLEKEDIFFLKHQYVRAMTQYLQANKIDPQKGNTKLLEKARTYAIKEAQRATYRDASAIATAISRFSQTHPVAGILVEGNLPFKKTPINILKRGVEYSPAGLLDGLTRNTARLIRGKITVSEYIDRLSSGLSGTGVVVLGAWLASMGLLSGGAGDEKEDKFTELQGEQRYAVQLGELSYTVDWTAPVSLPLFVGVELQTALSGEYEGLQFKDYVEKLMGITEPMFNISMLNGLNNTLRAVMYGKMPLTDMATQTVSSYLGQAMPTLMGQVARTVDETRRTTYIDKNSALPNSLQRPLQRNMNKVPFLSKRSEPYIDAWGREEVNGDTVLSRLFQNMVSPGYLERKRSSAMETELARLYDATGDDLVLPGSAAKQFMVGEEKLDLTGSQYTEYARVKGETAYEMLTESMQSWWYGTMTDSEKVEAVESVYKYANTVGKKRVSKYEAGDWTEKAIVAERELGVSPETYIYGYVKQKGIESMKDAEGESIQNSRGLQVMEMVYMIPKLDSKGRKRMMDDFGVGKTILHYNRALVEEELGKIKRGAYKKRKKRGA